MFRVTHLSGFGGGQTLDPSTGVLLSAMTTKPTVARVALIDDLIRSLKENGLWAKLDLLYVCAAADSQAAKLNWKNPGTNTLTEYNTPTFTTDSGFQGNGSNMYLGTGVNANALTNFQQNSAHMGTWTTAITGAPDGYGIGLAGSTDSHVERREAIGGTTFAKINQTSGGAQTGSVATGVAQGYVCGNRSGSSAVQVYRDDSSVATDTTSSTTPAASEIVILRVSTSYDDGRIGIAHVGASLSGADVTNIYAAFNAYISGL